jgi:hypothetical protein
VGGRTSTLLGGIEATRVVHRAAALGTFGYFLVARGSSSAGAWSRRSEGLSGAGARWCRRARTLRDLLQNLAGSSTWEAGRSSTASPTGRSSTTSPSSGAWR